ncbi:hypothetical protein [Streptomyces sp. KL116D]|uniref:hypothetical protein n=1 Tax=Streptomyces sp. KL116D TaxID=3045152 RepID=UPI003555F618
MTGTVTVQQMTINGLPYTCPACESRWFTLDAVPRFAQSPANANCYYGHHWTDALITGATMAMIAGSATHRRKANTFTVTVGGALLEGTLQPEVTAADIRDLVKVHWTRLLKPTLRRQKRAALRAATKPVKNAARTAAGAVKSGALKAAWTAQAGGYDSDPDYQPEPVIPCGACDGEGSFPIDSKIHDATRVKCSACNGTGETP